MYGIQQWLNTEIFNKTKEDGKARSIGYHC